MIFGEIFYYCFLFVCVFLYWLFPLRCRSIILSICGILFYYYYAGNFAWLLMGITFFSWVLLFKESSWKIDNNILSYFLIFLFVSVLAFFKYRGFLGQIFHIRASTSIGTPLAISFFIFEFIHVTAEKSKGTIKKINFFDYCSFVFFFPTMIAGPIKRYNQFEPYIRSAKLKSTDVLEAVFRISFGLFKKMVIADNLNSLINVLGQPSATSNVMLSTAAVILYGFRIYLDFSGYSDIAIGSARLFGFRVPENFLHPYRQSNISAFWRHWHISLYSWLIDYIFIPLGGSRGKLSRSIFNIMVVMLVSGIWHGAAWNFILWGVWHGVLLSTHKIWSDTIKPHLPQGLISGRPVQLASYALTMACVWFGWMLFMWPLSEIQKYLQLVIK